MTTSHGYDATTGTPVPTPDEVTVMAGAARANIAARQSNGTIVEELDFWRQKVYAAHMRSATIPDEVRDLPDSLLSWLYYHQERLVPELARYVAAEMVIRRAASDIEPSGKYEPTDEELYG